MSRHFKATLLASLLLCGHAALAADTPAKLLPPLRGTLTAVNGDLVTVADRQGESLSVHLTEKTRILSISTASPDAIKPDSFIGTAAVMQPNGTLKALEVHVFAPSLRGSGEGFRPWESADGTKGTMTNGTVGKLVNAHGRTMTVMYHGGKKTVIVPDDVPVVSIEPGDRSLLKSGAHIILFSAQDSQGQRIANAISVGKGGIVPPM